MALVNVLKLDRNLKLRVDPTQPENVEVVEVADF